MLSTNEFVRQSSEHKELVLSKSVNAKVAVADEWNRYVGNKGEIVGMSGYAESKLVLL